MRNERLRESGSEGKNKEKEVFVKRKKESHGECEEVGEMKRMNKKKWRDGKS